MEQRNLPFKEVEINDIDLVNRIAGEFSNLDSTLPSLGIAHYRSPFPGKLVALAAVGLLASGADAEINWERLRPVNDWDMDKDAISVQKYENTIDLVLNAQRRSEDILEELGSDFEGEETSVLDMRNSISYEDEVSEEEIISVYMSNMSGYIQSKRKKIVW